MSVPLKTRNMLGLDCCSSRILILTATSVFVYRLTRCHYSRIGCQWRGPHHELQVHTQVCSHPLKTGGEVMDALDLIDQKLHKEQMLYNTIFELLSFEKITFNGGL